MKQSVYTPLRFAQYMDVSTLPDNTLANTIRRIVSEGDDALNFMKYDTDFMNPDYNGPYRYINDFLFKNRVKLYGMLTGRNEIPVDGEKYKKVAAEMFSGSYMVNEWAKNKQVYKFDAELELALAGSDEIKLPVRILDRLPYRTFYIDFADNGIFKSRFHGAFLHVVQEKTEYLVYIMRVKEDGRSMSGNIALVPNDDPNGTFFFAKETILQNSDEPNAEWCQFGFFLINALLYLCADNNEVKESEITKQTYRPSHRIKNKFSEIRKWECGYRYGATIRKSKEDSADDIKPNDGKPCGVKRSNHKPVVEHVRRAHWHHYWTGKRDGDRVQILHWIPPTIVHGQKCEAAVIHPVRDDAAQM